MCRLARTRTFRVVRHTALLFVSFLLIGNLVILSLHGVARADVGIDRVEGVEGVGKIRRVDDRLWAGANPSRLGLESLAAAGVTTIVDLRAEHDAREADAFIDSLGMHVVHIPVRDGQIPGRNEIAEFVDIVERAPGTVYVHCGAGVGRTGSMAAAYLVACGGADASSALAVALAVGPPSLEQVYFIRSLDSGDRPPAAVVGISRVLDAPRRIWSGLRG